MLFWSYCKIKEFSQLSEEQFDIVYEFVFAGAFEITSKRIVESKDIVQIPKIADMLNRFIWACSKVLTIEDFY